MRIAKDDIPTKIDVPGAVARQAVNFGDAADCGSLGVVRDANVILFSPQIEHGKLLDHMLAQMAG